MKKVAGLLSIIACIAIVSCGGGSSSSDDPSGGTESAQQKVGKWTAASVGYFVESYVVAMDASTYNFDGTSFSIKGPRTGTGGVYSYSLDLVWKTKYSGGSSADDEDSDFTIIGNVHLDCTYNDSTGVFTAKITPNTGDITLVDLTSGITYTVSSYSLDYSHGDGSKATGTATINGTETTINAEW